jgi:hypothetical protein
MPGQETEETIEQIEEELQTSLLEVAKQFGQAIRLRAFYPKGHGVVGGAVARLMAALEPILQSRSEITIGSTGESLLFEGVEFGGENKPAQKLAECFKVRDISGITFRNGLQQPDLEEAIEILSESPEVFASPESPLRDRDPQSGCIGFRQIHYDKILRHVSEEEAKSIPQENMEGIWHSLIREGLSDDSGPAPAEAKAMMEESVQDSASFQLMTGRMLKASEKYAGDRAAAAANGVRKTCELLSELVEDKKKAGMGFLAEALENMDPDILLKLVEKQDPEAVSGDQKMVVELTQSMPVGAKLGVLAALVRSQESDTKRISSVFSIIAGAEKRRRELMKAIERNANTQTEAKGRNFEMIWSAVQDLVIPESEGRFVAPEYVSMLEDLGSNTTSEDEGMEDYSDGLNELRRSLDPARMIVAQAEYLIDLLNLQDDPERLKITLRDLESTCKELNRSGEHEMSAGITCELASLLPDDKGGDPARFQTVRGCLLNMFNEEAGLLALEKMAQDDVLLKSTLSSLGGELCGRVCELAAESEAAFQNKDVASYIRVHAAAAARILGEALPGSPAEHAKGLLKILSFLGTGEALLQMESALEHHDAQVQFEVIKTFVGSDSRRAKNIVQRLLDGEDNRLARLTAAALGESGSLGAAGVLMDSLDRLDILGRRMEEIENVAAALGNMKSVEAVSRLEKVLNKRLLAGAEKKRHFRKAIAMALADIGNDEARGALERGARRRNRGVSDACRKALEREGRTDSMKGKEKKLEAA